MLRDRSRRKARYPIQEFCIDENLSAADLERDDPRDAESLSESGALCSLLIVCVDTPEEA